MQSKFSFKVTCFNWLKRISFLSAILFQSIKSDAQEIALFSIEEEGKYGFINQSGDVVIDPQYLEVNEFNEGFAGVRIDGRYGFINSKGELALPAIYDYVGRFQQGIADVYLHGEVYFIDYRGDKKFPDSVNTIRFVNDSVYAITTKTWNSGLYNIKTKSFTFAPSRQFIYCYYDGLAVVRKHIGEVYGPNVVMNSNPYRKPQPAQFQKYDVEYGVINTTGELVVDFGVYDKVYDFINGFAFVKLKEKIDSNAYGIIDTTGRLIKLVPKKMLTEIPFEKPVKELTRFINGRAFVAYHDNNWYLIDTNFNALNEVPYNSFGPSSFDQNYGYVETNGMWGVIDKESKYILNPTMDFVHIYGLKDSLYVCWGENRSKLRIKNINTGHFIIPSIIQSMDDNWYRNGVISVVVDNKRTYYNSQGVLLWQNKPVDQVQNNKTLDITYLKEAEYIPNEPLKFIDSTGNSTNSKIPYNINASLITEDLVLYADSTSLFVCNYSKDTVWFDSKYGHLYLTLQAQDENSNWLNVDYVRKPIWVCGSVNDGYNLPRNTFYKFEIDRFNGVMETKFRYKLNVTVPVLNKKSKTYYSNEFSGSVNPGQFWRKVDNKPKSIRSKCDDILILIR